MSAGNKVNAKAGPSQPRKRKAGGEGKKGKVFLENKSDLLSLISNVTDSKESIVKSRLDKQKASLSEHPIKPDVGARLSRTKGTERQGQEKKSAKRERALEKAKEGILQRQKEKRARIKQRAKPDSTEPSSAAGGKVKKKSVGFA